ncbi:BA75_02435T0 [Komagataella pastoris]|uniref:BA75_02435T0 n=1 Tax=Komagataella pastoris TaxID=4922 RepID=A0A1B2JBC5_PICPA|nr:BA75_02435T0 [Komagataella pastoris]
MSGRKTSSYTLTEESPESTSTIQDTREEDHVAPGPQQEAPKQSHFQRWLHNYPKVCSVLSWVWKFWLKQWFLICLGPAVALAHAYPNFARHDGTIRSEYTINYGAVAIIFFISGLTMKTKDFLKNFGHWRAHFTVLSCSFLITSSIIYGIACGIRAAHDSNIDDWMLAGLIVTACCPTTVSSNVVMTEQAHGNVFLSICEVIIGNVLGGFITPALVQLYLTGTWDFANPALDSSVTDVYRNVMQQVGCAVFVPVFVGQVLQNLFPAKVKWCAVKFRLSKVGTFMLLLIMWASFSTAFYQHAFTSVPSTSIIFLCFFNLGIYLFFTLICYLYSRPRFLLSIFHEEPTPQHSKFYRWGYKTFRPFYYNRPDTVSVMLCGAAKTAALGVSLITSQYGEDSPHLGQLLVPLVLYQSQQVAVAQILVPFMKKWVHSDPEYIDKDGNMPNKFPQGNDEEVSTSGSK